MQREASQRRERDAFLDSAAWRKLSAYKLATDPLCQSCATVGKITPATQVHHVRPRSKHPELALVLTNLESLCAACHGRETRREQQGG